MTRRLVLLLVAAFVAVVAAPAAHAQLTLTRADIEVLYSTEFDVESFGAVSPTPAAVRALIDQKGANQTWDFTGFTYGAGDVYRQRYVNPPDGLPGSGEAAFAAADFAIAGEYEQDSSYAVYFDFRDDGFYTLGTAANMDGGGAFRQVYQPPLIGAKLPLTFGTAFSGTSSYTMETAGITVSVQQTNTTTVDGYGTVITPAGSFACLRMELKIDLTTTVFGQGITTTSYVYSWFTDAGPSFSGASATYTPSSNPFVGDLYTASYSTLETQGGGTPGGGAPAATTPAGPADGASGVSATPTLTWNASAGAQSYHVQVSLADDFASLTIDDDALATTTYVVSDALVPSETYYWRVRARNADGDSPWSNVWSFTTAAAAPAQVTLGAPADGATGVAPDGTLSWEAVGTAEGYDLQVATTADFASSVVDEEGLSETSYTLALAGGTLYYWRIRGRNSAGVGPWSATFSFTTASGVGVEPREGAVPEAFSLEGNFPNPFSASTTIHFRLANPEHAVLDVYDATGRHITRLVDQHMPAGSFGADFEAHNLPSGVYLVRLSAGAATTTRTITLIR